jgi:hypothetical protein
MKKYPWLLAALLAAVPVPARADAFADQLLNIIINVEGCPAQEPLLLQFAQQAQAAGQNAWAMQAHALLAACHVGNPAQAIADLQRSAQLGLDDCFFLRGETFKALQGQPGMQALVAQVKQSPADFKESVWQLSEVMAINHDTSMMITENMNRKDHDWTQVPQAALPTRPTRSPTLLTGRQFLAALQKYQRSMVMHSDQSRMSHLNSVMVLNNMGSGNNGPSNFDVQQSRNRAQQAFLSRQAAVNQRGFNLPPGTSTTPVTCDKF